MFGFDKAIQLLKEGKKVKRAHWGGYWFIANPIVFKNLEAVEVDGKDAFKAESAIAMNVTILANLKDNAGLVPATAYQEDLLAEDWSEVE